MRFRHASVAVAGTVILAACSDRTAPVAPSLAAARVAASEPGAAAGRYDVLFTGERVPADFAATVARLGGRVESAQDDIGFASITGLSDAAAAELRTAAGVQYVVADLPLPLEKPAAVQRIALDAIRARPLAPSGDATASAAAPSAALLYGAGYQWNMTAIGAPTAWRNGALGSGAVTIGILDTGIDDRNVDVAGRVDASKSASMLTRHPQFDSTGNVIRDGSGNPILVSDDDSVTAHFGAATPKWVDLQFHGTHVAATASSNALLSAGVTSRTKLAAIKVCSFDARVGCPTSAVLNGIAYAASHGVAVINMSLGGWFPKSVGSARGGDGPAFVALIDRFLNYARKQGVTVVVAAGNAGLDLDHDGNGYAVYCSNPNVICVAATGPSHGDLSGDDAFTGGFSDLDEAAVYSNYGRSAIDVAAPGGNFTAAIVQGRPTLVSGGFVWAACSMRSIVEPDCQQYSTVIGLIGTSQATPHVSGLAALLVERLGRDPAAIRAAIEGSADDLGPQGTDPRYGRGRIDVARALGLN